MTSRIGIKLILATAIIFSLISLAGVITLIIIWQKMLAPFQDFAVVVDAGSTHSTIFIYTWPADKSDGLGLTSRVNQEKACDVPGGPISSITDPSVNNIKQYFDTAMTACLNTIPSTRKGRSLIFLGATAGLRVIEMKNREYISNLLNATRAYFSTLELQFAAPESQVRIISGSEEGLSGWITTNILMRELYVNNNPLETYGVSDIGGASTQLSFIAPDAISDRCVMNLFNTNYSIYSHSYLCYGTEQMRYVYLSQLVQDANGSLTIDDPCLQSGYVQTINASILFDTPCVSYNWTDTTAIFSFRGAGNSIACTNAVRARFDKSNCSTNSCSFNNVYQPIPISASLKFIAISSWYPLFKSLADRVPLQPDSDKNYNFSSTNLTQVKAAIMSVCNEPWLNVTKPDSYRPSLCFTSTYQWTLFEYGYSMTDANLKQLQIVKTIDSNDIGWTLGYMINQTNYLDPEFRPTRLLTKGEFIGILVACIVVLIASLVVIIAAVIFLLRSRDYATKTV